MRRSIILALAIILGIVIFAYGFEVTQVDLQQLGSPVRQASLARIMRALARPDFIQFEQEEFVVETPLFVPCPPGGLPPLPEPDRGEPYMVVEPPCADPRAVVTVEGFNFAPNTAGPLNFIPPSGVSLQLGRIETDANGHFVLTVPLRDRVSEEPQLLRAVTRRSVGWPQLSSNGVETINRIIETVFMAFLATVLGTLLSIPLSFFAAKNLMRMVTSPLASISLSILAIPIGVWLGATIARALGTVSQMVSTSLLLNVSGVLVAPVLVWGVMRWALPRDEPVGGEAGVRPLRWLALLGIALATLLALYFLSDLARVAGQALAPQLGRLGFIGQFIADIGEILRLILLPVTALVGAGLLSSRAGGLGQHLVERGPSRALFLVHVLLAVAAGAVLAALIGAGIDWFYQFNNPAATLYWPALVGAFGGLLLALRYPYQASLPVGLAIYNVVRTVLNALRSVEALIMVIVFAVWVGIGPFAGVLALGLHTVAALAKLYSEQVEDIAAGPIEAVLATGANRLQMIVYAVIPQIIPPYISFTMYRWDINVRMSTIIGFAGGGGIGFLLQQNINLLNYRAASAQILAIAIVVSLMDYLSSALRQRAI
jgi:phosphonate ABC transporter permease subunit PhnE